MDGLEEMNLGIWEGLSWEEVEGNYPSDYAKWLKNRRYEKPPMGESYQELLERVLKAFQSIINNNSGDVVIVTHSAVIMTLQCYITNTPFDEMIIFKTENTSITEINSNLII